MIGMKRTVLSLVSTILVTTLAACGSGAGTSATAAGEPATVRFVDVEAGCWVLETASGRVQPVELAEEFRIDGLEVTVVLRDAPDMMSLCQVGPLKTVESIARR
jgi:hypothetical protein